MRTPAEVARQIKQSLRDQGIKGFAHARCYQIKVKADGSEKAKEIAREIYHQEKHCWLIVWVDGQVLLMPN